MEDQIVTIWLPLVITAVFGIVGLVRGAMREGVMAASVVLAAFIIREWGDQWGQSLHEVFPQMPQGQQQFALSTGVLWVIVLGLGYGLGGTLMRERPVRASRIGGGLLGLATGAAVAGYMLLYAYTSLDGAETTSRFYQSIVSRAFMVWAGWYPLVLAFIGAILVLVGPMRRAQRAVGKPSTASNWTPTTPPTAPAPAMASTMFAATQAAPPVIAPYGAGAQQTVAMPAPEPSRTTIIPPMPAADAASLPTRPAAGAEENDLSATRALGSTDGPRSPWQGPPSSIGAEGGTPGSDSEGTFNAPGNDSSWLLQPVSGGEQGLQANSPAAAPGGAVSEDAAGPLVATTSFGNEYAIGARGVAGQAGGSQAQGGTDKKCPGCGAQVAPGASFCTECGTRIV
jgi:uncharacterized membrane protein required for colicin V production